MTDELWRLRTGDGPVVATAIHDGHVLREEVAALSALSDEARLREEDPYTGAWTAIAPTSLIADRSRFEVDLNRPRDNAVYVQPADAWGLNLWRRAPSEALVTRSLEEYDAFYSLLGDALTGLVRRFGAVVVLDLHSYNHRRQGPDGPKAAPAENPEVNVGTGTLDRTFWGPLVDRFVADLRGHDFLGAHLDVRENVKFQGGNMSRFIHQNFPQQVCSLSVEFKKFFMDEWSGELDRAVHDQITPALRATIPGLGEELQRIAQRAS